MNSSNESLEDKPQAATVMEVEKILDKVKNWGRAVVNDTRESNKIREWIFWGMTPSRSLVGNDGLWEQNPWAGTRQYAANGTIIVNNMPPKYLISERGNVLFIQVNDKKAAAQETRK